MSSRPAMSQPPRLGNVLRPQQPHAAVQQQHRQGSSDLREEHARHRMGAPGLHRSVSDPSMARQLNHEARQQTPYNQVPVYRADPQPHGHRLNDEDVLVMPLDGHGSSTDASEGSSNCPNQATDPPLAPRQHHPAGTPTSGQQQQQQQHRGVTPQHHVHHGHGQQQQQHHSNNNINHARHHPQQQQNQPSSYPHHHRQQQQQQQQQQPARDSDSASNGNDNHRADLSARIDDEQSRLLAHVSRRYFADSSGEDVEQWHNPYDIGLYGNLCQVLGPNPLLWCVPDVYYPLRAAFRALRSGADADDAGVGGGDHESVPLVADGDDSDCCRCTTGEASVV
eukprot:TRINITY_DN65949_c9_g1_i3.p1 TRINITY_DN65949_c9_g1~~TRINITY_DN65949_c9_g1_i3.p1  ORF type:complete len:337 (-),score=103.80 TRINITY_DN65949_c9_g1_i3:8-1018(-)